MINVNGSLPEQLPSLAPNMTEIESFNVSITDEDDRTMFHNLVTSPTTTLSTDNSTGSWTATVGREYIAKVQSVNKIGTGHSTNNRFCKWNDIINTPYFCL